MNNKLRPLLTQSRIKISLHFQRSHRLPSKYIKLCVLISLTLAEQNRPLISLCKVKQIIHYLIKNKTCFYILQSNFSLVCFSYCEAKAILHRILSGVFKPLN